jgi:hypothetical protein
LAKASWTCLKYLNISTYGQKETITRSRIKAACT